MCTVLRRLALETHGLCEVRMFSKVLMHFLHIGGSLECRICFASLAGSLAQAARKPRVKGFQAESLVRPLLRMARYCNSAMQSAAFLALGHLMSYPAAQQVLCEVSMANVPTRYTHPPPLSQGWIMGMSNAVLGPSLLASPHCCCGLHSSSCTAVHPPSGQHVRGSRCLRGWGLQDAKHLAILTDILVDAKAQLSLKAAVCTILRAAAQADAVSMSALTQVHSIAPSHGCCYRLQNGPPPSGPQH